jgi:2-haloacid dehalogenase
MAVRALVFDVFGTLVDWRSGIAAALARSGAQGDPGELADAWRMRFLLATQEVVRGERPWADVDALHAETGPEALVGDWHRLDPWPDVPGGLEALREHRVVATLSNGHIAMLVAMARHAGMRFDALLSAELAQTYKPDPAVYALAPRYLGLAPEEIMLVAAHPIDLAAARAAGLRSAYVDRPLEYGPGSPHREDPEADVSVSDLHELAAAL